MDSVDRKRLRDLALAATPGPWKRVAVFVHVVDDACPVADARCVNDAAFIAAANPQTILELLDALEAAEQGEAK